ncbi:MAG: LysR family transcriptional regulator [Paludibacterium sp.]|uniref:LysR family transcriptional regulator n=1 Tax=Paludibacterium sp. TaxID=1917523 RepID=UPI0025FD4C4D|nr:LysR family transcriptional regulator [Paludibacterium sp.]MBV8047685.1 LysR family transcriptional regulator [Paludibacterium sp.]MBV8647088.1 LysR family transcriptional regulator [Paludibacterium sp.]
MHDVDFTHGDLRRVDLNLLVAFDALFEARHVSRAAARLHLGQPAMSHALARLREVFHDPLFIRSGSRMEPTARALALAGPIRDWLTLANRILFSAGDFDPARVTASYAIAAPDGLEALLYPALIARLRQRAPGVQLRAQLLEIDQQLAALDRDEVDLLISAAPLMTRDWHGQQLLGESGFVALFSRRQLSLPPKPGLAELAACEQVASSYRGSQAGVVDHLFAEHGLSRRIVAMSASLMATGRILQQAPLISIQPAFYLPLFAALPDLHHLPLDPALRIQINLIWHRRNDSHPLHRFLREQVVQSVSSLSDLL